MKKEADIFAGTGATTGENIARRFP